ncbi:deubiquitinating enzyme [Mycoemilia scoparia]|uniref:Ubiquitin carboxyl-terminal hydrolase n=1 Tax=Mycoemilia scoparia TaxID=417184 RepID=A0A9W8A2P3_9FUNG|nr:deubiquitinating enzyme [Mycoemilia scoparia]
MSSQKIVLSWKGKKFDLEAEPNDTLADIRFKILSCTEVSPEHQKLIVAGKTLKAEEENFFKLNPKNKDLFMIEMKKPANPIPTSVAEDDDDDVESKDNKGKAADAMDVEKEEGDIPTGLKNLGNTCFMNATIQCLNTVPIIRKSLADSPNIDESDPNDATFTRSLGKLIGEISKSEYNFIIPDNFLSSLEKRYPEMVEKDEKLPVFVQQDAEECWLKILSSLNRSLKTKDGVSIKKYFSGQFETTLTNTESKEEEPIANHEEFLKIATGITKESRHLNQSILESFTQTLEKESPTLGRSAKYESKTLISRLPEYLTIHLLRFEFRKGVTNTAKIMKEVDLPMELNMAHHCTKPLKEKFLKVQRHLEKVHDSPESVTETFDQVVDPEIKADVGSNQTGLYELTALITHQGRSANSGHYIAWARVDESEYPSGYDKHKRNADMKLWYQFNDHEVTMLYQKDIRNLFGGRGDSPTAYLGLYSAKKLE